MQFQSKFQQIFVEIYKQIRRCKMKCKEPIISKTKGNLEKDLSTHTWSLTLRQRCPYRAVGERLLFSISCAQPSEGKKQ